MSWQRSNIGTILDYSVEGKSTDADFDRTKDEIIKNIERAKNDPAIPFAVFKVTGVAPLGTLERMSGEEKARREKPGEMRAYAQPDQRDLRICASVGQPVFIDAEEIGYRTQSTGSPPR